ncbi:MAG: sulfatase-like hydrolase/transferase [Planctomycetaceae bacterium]
MSRPIVLLPACLVFIVLITCPRQSPADEPRPNVIVFLVDDLGWTDAGCYGSDLYETPHIDRLAADGVRFTDAYAACTVCSPTRAAMMTGMYPARLHVTDWIDGHWEGMNAARRSEHPLMPPDWTQHLEHRYTTIAEALQANGYRTAHVGKWHLTPRSTDKDVVEPFYPQHQGFDVNIAGNQWGAPGSYYWPYRHPGGTGVDARVENFPPDEETRDKYLTDMLTDRTVALLREWKDQPFFLYFPYYQVHRPIQGRKDLVEKYQGKITPQHRHRDAGYAAMVESVDISVGRIRATLDELGVSDNTLIVYTSDNGGLDYDEKSDPTDNAPLRNGKGSAYEGGVRVPMIVSWPGVTPAGTVSSEPVITCDFYPTILEITRTAGDATHNENVDGRSLVPLLKDPKSTLDRDALYWHYPHYHNFGASPYSAVRARDWRLVEFYEDDRSELYNLADDLSETTDLSAAHPEKKRELLAMLNRWRDDMGAQPPLKNPSFQPVGDKSADFRPLFNGEDLSGWVPVNTAPSTWSVEDGLLVCSGKPIGELRTDRMYQNFILELEWRHLAPKGNAGVFVWADDITARGVPFHRSVEVQVLENTYGNSQFHSTHGDIFPIHGAKMTPVNGRGGDRAFPTELRSRAAPNWNHYRITCQDGNISLAVNGKLVTQGTDCSPRKGYICLESEGGLVHYRNIRIQELPDTPVADEHVAIADRGYRCLYNGINLDGWTVSGSASEWKPKDWILTFEGKSSGTTAAISTEEQFGDFGFVLDVKLNESSGVPRIQLRGSDTSEIAIDPADKRLTAHLQPPGRWNRIEGTLAGSKLTLYLNGALVVENQPLAAAPAAGPLTIIPDGPLEIANQFVRALTP